MPRLTKEYLQNHMKESSSEKYEADSLETFADALIDRLLATATEQFESNSEERDEVQVSLPVTLRPEDVEGALGCIKVCIGGGAIPAEICYHRGFQGNKPGPGSEPPIE